MTLNLLGAYTEQAGTVQMNRKKIRKRKIRKKVSSRTRQINLKLKAALNKYNSQDHSGKSVGRIISEVGDIVGRSVRDQLDQIDAEENLKADKPKKNRRKRKP